MATEITLAEVDQAEAALRNAKKSGKGHTNEALDVADIRRAYREQEEAAGRRSGFVTVKEG